MVNVNILSDELWEFDEVFFGGLAAVTSVTLANYAVSPSQSSAEITDNDGTLVPSNHI